MKHATATLGLAALSTAAVIERAPPYTVVGGETISYTAGAAVIGGMTVHYADGNSKRAPKHTVDPFGVTVDYSANPTETHITAAKSGHTAIIDAVDGETSAYSNWLQPRVTDGPGLHERDPNHKKHHTVDEDGVTWDYSTGRTKTHITAHKGSLTAVLGAHQGHTWYSSNFLAPRVTAAPGCCFNIDAFSNGGPSGPVGQLGDGQNRIEQSGLPEGKYCIDANSGLTDAHGRGCILTPPTTQ